jgi:regulator of cell morphogenesis and NO signaling
MPDSHSPETLTQQSLAEIVANDSRTADVFERFGLDYCCRGQQSLETATLERRVALLDVIAALDALGPPTVAGIDCHMTGTTSMRSPATSSNATTVTSPRRFRSSEGGSTSSSIVMAPGMSNSGEVRETFNELADELIDAHGQRGKPAVSFINELAAAERARTRLPRGPFGTILHPVHVMESDHEEAGELLQRLRYLTRDYQPPSDGCTTYQLCYRELERFEGRSCIGTSTSRTIFCSRRRWHWKPL